MSDDDRAARISPPTPRRRRLRRPQHRARGLLRLGRAACSRRSTATATTWCRSGSPARAAGCWPPTSPETLAHHRRRAARGRRRRRRGRARRRPDPPGAGGPRAGPGAARSSARSTWSCRCCTGRTARTARSRGCSSWPACRYVGSGVFASAAAMDKGHMKTLLQGAGLPVGPYAVVTPRALGHRPRPRSGRPSRRWATRCFVKPARAGSSVGITKVHGPDELDDAIEVARAHDPRVVVEAMLEGREIECGVLEGLDGGPPEASVPGEVRGRRRPRVLRLRRQVPARRGHRPGRAGRPARRGGRRGAGAGLRRRSRRWPARAWPGSTSSSRATGGSSSTR